jgi:hypothetical protein
MQKKLKKAALPKTPGGLVPVVDVYSKGLVDEGFSNNVCKDLKKLIETPLFSDVKVLVGNNSPRVFKLHRNILAIRSDYFKVYKQIFVTTNNERLA